MERQQRGISGSLQKQDSYDDQSEQYARLEIESKPTLLDKWLHDNALIDPGK